MLLAEGLMTTADYHRRQARTLTQLATATRDPDTAAQLLKLAAEHIALADGAARQPGGRAEPGEIDPRMQAVIDRLEEMRQGLRLLTDAVQRGNRNEAEHIVLVIGGLLEEVPQEARRGQKIEAPALLGERGASES
jgi:hypothetical protein